MNLNTNHADNSEDVCEFVDSILATLVTYAPTAITAIAKDSDIDEQILWTAYHTEDPIANCSRRRFSAILARIGSHVLNGQLYCGCASRELRIGDHRAMCIIYLANCTDTGHWVKMSSRRL